MDAREPVALRARPSRRRAASDSPRRPRRASSRLGHERADDVRLAALVQQPAHAREHLVAAVEAEHAGDDRRSPRRHLVEHRHLEVAVDGERQRPRDRGRGHVQHVRRRPLAGLLLERPPLLDAEPVLLVDDGHAQRPRSRRRAWIRACVPTATAGSPDRSTSARARRSRAGVPCMSPTTRTPSGSHRSASPIRCWVASVSVGAISAPWPPASTAAHERVRRDGGLAGADIALQQPPHRHGRGRDRRRSRRPPGSGRPVSSNGSALTNAGAELARAAAAAARWPPPRTGPGGASRPSWSR